VSAALVSGVRRRRVPPAVVVAIVGAWTVAVVAQLTGRAELFGHDALIEGGTSAGVALGVFLVAWQLMIVAMMLPSSLPLVRLFRTVAANQAHPSAATAALLGGYALVWTSFGAAAFLGDMVLHRLVDEWGWLGAHPQVIGGSVLMLAGAFQFSELKDKCLRECRHPVPFLVQRYGRGAAEAFRLGRAHGLFCLGCCWALMLVGFAVGVASLWWMAVLTAIMVFEKTARGGERAVKPVGAWLVAAGLLTLIGSSLAGLGAT
jgi:predicted metal-binding membrane protein